MLILQKISLQEIVYVQFLQVIPQKCYFSFQPSLSAALRNCNTFIGPSNRFGDVGNSDHIDSSTDQNFHLFLKRIKAYDHQHDQSACIETEAITSTHFQKNFFGNLLIPIWIIRTIAIPISFHCLAICNCLIEQQQSKHFQLQLYSD